MSRTIKEIYNGIITERNKRLELSEFSSDSKMGVMNTLAWTTAAAIHSFETLLDVFAVDISTAINQRVNGTPTYYANALLQYQQGDELTVRKDGLAFGYANVDETKRIITQVSYIESTDDTNLDSKLILKVAVGEKGHLEPLPVSELVPVNAYINKMKFAGTRIEVISREGDILIPRISVFFDGGIPESEIYDKIEEKLDEYIMQMPFDSSIYVSSVIEAVRSVEHVTDVYINEEATPEQGIFIASYDTDGNLLPARKVRRTAKTSSGFMKQSSATGKEQDLPTFRQAIKLIVEG
ncbi:MAG: hypothetical protein ACK5LF_03785 [Bacteroides xylanisolvens]